MDSERWERVKEIFDEASSTPDHARIDLVKRLAGGDAEMEREALALLEHAGKASESFLASPMDPGPAAHVFRPGDLIAGRYRIERFLAAGGMGEVYAAEDMLLHARIAMKTVHPAIVRDENSRRRFRQEIQTARRVAHPNVCRVFDIGVHGHAPAAEQHLFLTMELLEGETLAACLKRGVRYSLAEARPLLHSLTEAVQAAHDVQVIHRDLKPANIFLTSASTGLRLVVTDFGIARDISDTSRPQGEDVTTRSLLSGIMLGTPAYMAPELLHGGRATVASDLYALGVVMYEMAVGKRPFASDTPFAEALKKVKEPPPAPSQFAPDLDPRWERVILRCLDPDPALRFGSAREVFSALAQDAPAPAVLAAPAPRWSPALLVAGGLAALLLCGVAYTMLRPVTKSDTAAQRPTSGPELSVRPLTSHPGIERQPNFSADGQRIAYTWTGETGDNIDIYSISMAGERSVRLTSAPEQDEAPAFSPDGQSLAFIRRPRGAFTHENRRCPAGTLWVMSPDGKNERELATNGRIQSIDWTRSSEVVYAECEDEGMAHHSIYVMSLVTGARRRLTTPQEGTRGDPYFAVSPDGRSLALVRWLVSPSSDIVVRPLEGGSERVLFRDPSLVGHIAWSPDGSHIIFTSRVDGRERLSRLPADGPSVRPVAIPGLEPGAEQPAIHASGRLAFDRVTQNADIWSYDLERGGGKAVVASTRRDSSAQVSPDSRRIVFSSDRTGVSDIWAADANGRNLIQLTSGLARSGAPTWSPDGKWIAFDTMAKGTKELWVVGADGSGLRQLTTEEKVEEGRAAFSADGQWVFHRSDRSGTRQLWKVPVVGGNPIAVTKNGGEEPRASADGKYLYYARDRRVPGIWRVPVDGGLETLVTDQPYFGFWDVTATGIYYLDVTVKGAEHPILLYDFATKSVRKVGVVARPIDRELPGFSVTRDGRTAFVLQIESLEGDIYLVEGFR